MDLSLCMIVRNEEKTLPDCLSSVQPVVDEIIVVDTGSMDGTIAVAKQFGAQVHLFPWCNDFAAARNESLKYAKGDWVLVLDADEVLVPSIVPALRQLMGLPDVLVINLLRQEVGNHPSSLISRLFRRRSDITFSRPYHELIDDSVQEILKREPDWRVVELPEVAIQHTGYQATTIAQRRKVDQARSMMESHLAEYPNDAYTCNKLGALYAELGDMRKGVELLKRGLQSAQDSPVLYELHYHLGSIYSQMQNGVEADFHYQKAVEQPVPARLKLGAYNNWGSSLKERGEFVRAKTLFQKAVEVDPTFAIGHFNLGLTHKALNDLPSAILCYNVAVHLNPTYADAYQNLGVALLKAGNVTESLKVFNRAIDLHRQQGSVEAERLQQGLKEMGFSVS